MSEMTTPAPMLTIEEAAREMRISRSYAYQLAARGELPAIRIGPGARGVLRIPRARFERWLAGQEVTQDEGDRP